MGQLCHFLGRECVCAHLHAGPGSGRRAVPFFFGQDVDRESGEFAAEAPQAGPPPHRRHARPGAGSTCLAHSRGTDVLVTALRELEIEPADGSGRCLDSRFRS